ncbi:MAG: two pore domain potassium channel family protein [Bacteroidetes bacterium]|nr:two pore domain potassium channel family protein [Bacteroidota bacterium]
MDNKDIGFGVKANQGGHRLVMPDGKFNVQRLNTKFDLFHHLITCPLSHFFLYVAAFYILFNAIFALAYNIIGIEHLAGIEPGGFLTNFLKAYFFSVQTFTTVGYGYVHPVGILANLFASFEALIGILSVSVISGILFGRFSQRGETIQFTKYAIITKLGDMMTFQFRIANRSRTELIEMEAKAVFSSFELIHGVRKRSYKQMKLEREKLMSEVVIMVSGYDDTSKSMIYSKKSYAATEFRWNTKVSPAFSHNNQGETVFDLRDLDTYIEEEN